MPDSRLFQRLKERKLVHWSLAYLAGAWVFYEAASTVGGHFGLSDLVFRGLFVVLVMGFFITLVLAWYHGEKGYQRVTGPELLWVAALLAAAGWGVSKIAPDLPDGPGAYPAPIDRVPLIAVLPLDDLTPGSDDQNFVRGLQEQLTSKLDRVPSIDVLSRTSADWWAGQTDKPPLKEMALQDGIDYVVEGSVRRWGDSIRVSIQLIQASSDRHLFSRDYDAAFTSVENYVLLQARVVQEIAADLRVPVAPDDDAWLTAVPTRSLEALIAFQNGVEIFLHERRIALVPSISGSVEYFDRAVALDPDFGMAYAYLASALRHSGDGRHRDRARVEAERAVDLAPEFWRGYRELAYHYERIGEPPRSREYLVASLERARGTDSLWIELSMATNLESAVRALEELRRLDPRNPEVHSQLALHRMRQHRYQQALAALDRWEVVEGARPPLLIRREAMIALLRGDLAGARALVAEHHEGPFSLYHLVPTVAPTALLRTLSDRDRRVAWEVYRSTGLVSEPDLPLTSIPCSGDDPWGPCLDRAIHERDVGSREVARILWDSLRAGEATWPDPEYEWDYTIRALVDMESGDLDGALRWARAGVAEYSADGCARSWATGMQACAMLARVLARAGEYDEALDVVEELLPAPSELTVHVLRLDPWWKDLWGLPRFEQILLDYADQVEVLPDS